MTPDDRNIIAQTLYGEARGEYASYGIMSLMAVAWVIRNRTQRPKRFGEGIQGVCLKPFQFSCWNTTDKNRSLLDHSLQDAMGDVYLNVADWIERQPAWADITRGSDHYHAASIKPYWAKGAVPRTTIGRHVFYRLG